jgi:hypothetical protein
LAQVVQVALVAVVMERRVEILYLALLVLLAVVLARPMVLLAALVDQVVVIVTLLLLEVLVLLDRVMLAALEEWVQGQAILITQVLEAALVL